MKDTPTFSELRQDQARHWQRLGQQRAATQEALRERLSTPWRCPSCGTGALTQPICPRCRSARIVEAD